MPTEASDKVRTVLEPPFLRKQNPELLTLYKRYKYLSNTKLTAQKKDGIAHRAALQMGVERAQSCIKMGRISAICREDTGNEKASLRPKAMAITICRGFFVV